MLTAYIFTQQIGTEFFTFIFLLFFFFFFSRLSELHSHYMSRYFKTNGMWTLHCWELLVCNHVELTWVLLAIAALISVQASNLNICSAFQKGPTVQTELFFSYSYTALSYLAEG